MATAPSNNSNSNKALRLESLKDAGVNSLWIGLATGMALFAIQTSVAAGKAVLADGKAIFQSLK
jgi:hypothetical protein